jgi:hypothetical protein
VHWGAQGAQDAQDAQDALGWARVHMVQRGVQCTHGPQGGAGCTVAQFAQDACRGHKHSELRGHRWHMMHREHKGHRVHRVHRGHRVAQGAQGTQGAHDAHGAQDAQGVQRGDRGRRVQMWQGTHDAHGTGCTRCTGGRGVRTGGRGVRTYVRTRSEAAHTLHKASSGSDFEPLQAAYTLYVGYSVATPQGCSYHASHLVHANG